MNHGENREFGSQAYWDQLAPTMALGLTGGGCKAVVRLVRVNRRFGMQRHYDPNSL